MPPPRDLLRKGDTMIRNLLEFFTRNDITVEEVLQFRNVFNAPIPCRVMSGIGPQYEDATLTLWLRFWKYLETKKIEEIDISSLEKDLELLERDINPSGHQRLSALHHALFVRTQGYSRWLSQAHGEIQYWFPHLEWYDAKFTNGGETS